MKKQFLVIIATLFAATTPVHAGDSAAPEGPELKSIPPENSAKPKKKVTIVESSDFLLNGMARLTAFNLANLRLEITKLTECKERCMRQAQRALDEAGQDECLIGLVTDRRQLMLERITADQQEIEKKIGCVEEEVAELESRYQEALERERLLAEKRPAEKQ